MSPSFINYGQHYIDEEDIAAVVDVLRNGNLTCGNAITQFEQAITNYIKAKYAVVCSSGTSALHMATEIAMKPGQVAIVPAITFLATANAVRYSQGEVIFSDVDPESGLMGPQQFLDAIKVANGKSIAAVLPVHLTGQCENIEEIAAIAKLNSISVIEDACHALGTKYKSSTGEITQIGDCKFSDMAVYSFHPVKHIATGEGGAVLCNNEAYADQLRTIRSHGMVRDSKQFVQCENSLDSQNKPNPWYYQMHQLGYNYRMSDIQAALGFSQLKKLDQFISKRMSLKNYYDKLLSQYAPLVRPIRAVQNCQAAWHIYSVLIEFDQLGLERSQVMRKLMEKGIGTQVHYIPVYKQPYYQKLVGNMSLPGAESYYAKTLTLPLFYNMTYQDVDYIVEQLLDVLGITK